MSQCEQSTWARGPLPEHSSRGLRRAIRQLPVPSDDLATTSALAGKNPPAQGFLERATTASTWFPSAGSRDDSIMMEQAMRLGDNGTLTMLVSFQF